MKTTLDIIDILYDQLKDSALKTAVSGGIYKNERPDDSTKEDVVINCLPVSGSQLQYATPNVNIYVPDLQIKIAGKPQYKPDFPRLKTLAGLASQLLRKVATPEYSYEIAFQGELREEATNQRFINIRLEFKTYNL